MLILKIFACAAVLLSVTVSPLLSASADPGIVPTPKQYKSLGSTLHLDGLPVYTETANTQCRIAAEELQLRIRELGGTPGATVQISSADKPGLYILPVSSRAAAGIAKALKLKISKDYPGRQGYVLNTAKDRVVIIGSDNVGTLYGAMTLRQMMRKSDNGKVSVRAASITDWPDYRIRSGVGYWRGMGYWTLNESDRLGAYKAGIDWMMRFKINLIMDYYDATDIRKFSPGNNEFLREVNAYAWERGIYPAKFPNTSVGNSVMDKDDKRFHGWDCIYTNGWENDGWYFCWSRDDLIEASARRMAEYCKATGFKILMLHPVDGGSIGDPEMWSKRCDLCREKYRSGERWKAEADQYAKWMKAFKTAIPDIVVTTPFYPYVPAYTDYTKFKSIVTESVWHRNSIEFWEHMQSETDKDLLPMAWEDTRKNMDPYRAIFKDRAAAVYAHCFTASGYFGTWHRFAGTNFKNPDDIYMLTGGVILPERWMDAFCDGEFAWNTKSPGAEDYKGLIYDIESDYSEPRVIVESWLPRACKIFYGEEIGSRIAPVYQLGIQPYYIMDPAKAITNANMWRKGLAEFKIGRDGALVSDSAARMKAQVDGTAKAMASLESAYPYLNTIDRHRRKSFMYFYKRMALWHMIASARYACYHASDLQREGKLDEARGVLEQALLDLEKNNQSAEAILNATLNEPDETSFGPVGPRGDTRPYYADLKTLLQNMLGGVGLVMKPRPVGAVAKVGLLKGFGAQGTKLYLDGFSNVQAEIIDTLALPVLDKYDCVFIFQTPSISKDEYFVNLASYVKEGGRGVLFQHDLCGFPRSQFGAATPFLEICQSVVDRRDAKKLLVKQAHPAVPGLAAGQAMDHMYYDHEVLKVGKEGTVVAVDEKGDPVVVAGSSGAGKVIFDGNVSITEADGEAMLTGFNAVLARGAVEWFTGLTLKPKK